MLAIVRRHLANPALDHRLGVRLGPPSGHACHPALRTSGARRKNLFRGRADWLLPPWRDLRNARLRHYQPGAVPGDVLRPRRRLLRESIPGGRRRQQQRLCLSAETPGFEVDAEAGR